jgi:hypothetical protein
MPKSTMRLYAFALGACLALFVAGCSDDDDDDPQPVDPPSGRIVKYASLDGAQETPPVATEAFGAGVLHLDESNGQVSGFVVTSGLVGATAAHVHLAPRGTPGGIIVPLTGGPDLWVVPDAAAVLNADQMAAFRNDTLYFNVHTAANPGGEIRGQIDKTGTARLAALDGAQETPAVATSAFGGGIFAVDQTSGEVSGFVMSSGLVDPTAAHVHIAPRGTPGPIVVPLTGGPDLWVVPDAAGPLDSAGRTAFSADGLYYNVHTAANPGGEIRGQLDKTGALRLTALEGAQETPAVATEGFGAGILAVDTATGEASGFVVAAGLPTANNAHVHAAPRGTPGGVIVPMTGAPDLWVIPDNAAPITGEQRTTFDAGGLYYNVHTPANPGGEIRGQLD